MSRFNFFVFMSMFFLVANFARGQKIEPTKEQDTFNIALLLPFNASSIEPHNLFDKKSFANADLAIDFFSGVTFALDEFSRNGMKIKLTVYDSKNDSSQLRRILYRSNFKKPDLIIGPIYPALYSVINNYSLIYPCPIISPISPVHLDKFKNPNFIMVAPPLEEYGKALANYVFEKKTNKKIIVLNTSDPIDKRLAKSFIKNYDSLNKPNKIFEFNPLLNGFDAFHKTLSTIDTNYILVSSSNVINVVSIFNEIKSYANNFPIVVLGHPNLEKVYTVDYSILEKMHLTIPSSNFNNLFYQNDSLMLAYREKFYTDPSEYAIKGYQLTDFFIKLYRGQPEVFLKWIDTDSLNNSSLFFVRSKFGTLINKKIKILRFQNSQLIDQNAVR